MSNSLTSPVVTDFKDIGILRAKARTDAQGTLKEVAKQMEGLFLNMMLKSMREASLGDPLLDSNEGDMYRDMLDQQMAMNISNGRGIGLAENLVRQLQPYVNNTAAPNQTSLDQLKFRSQLLGRGGDAAMPTAPLAAAAAQPAKSGFDSKQQFISALYPHAVGAARELGVDPKVLVAQAALETGWGKSVIRHGDGSSSHNLFNIKADRRWEGERVTVGTLEYKEGVPYRTQAAFRSYDSFAASFDDYVRFLKTNPRYADALRVAGNSQAYVQSLQQAGYATDPAYARKITQIMQNDLMA